jgi:hypothetical protein
MTSKKNKIIKISIIFLMFMLLFFCIKYFSIILELSNYKNNTELEIKILESKIGKILYKYDALSLDSLQNNTSFNSNTTTFETKSLLLAIPKREK